MDHAASHPDHWQRRTAHADSSGYWRLIIPHVRWRPGRDYTIIDRELDIPNDDDLLALARSLAPHATRMRPNHPVLCALVAERHFCRWAKLPMHWRDRSLLRHVYQLPSGSMAAVAGRWLQFTGELPRTLAIPYNGIPAATLVVAIGYTDFDSEPEFLGWQTTDYWKTHGHRCKLDSRLAGRSIDRTDLLHVRELKPQLSGLQLTLI